MSPFFIHLLKLFEPECLIVVTLGSLGFDDVVACVCESICIVITIVLVLELSGLLGPVFELPVLVCPVGPRFEHLMLIYLAFLLFNLPVLVSLNFSFISCFPLGWWLILVSSGVLIWVKGSGAKV